MEESRYVVSARKYRPATFASVVGQGALVTTLKNAIMKNKLAHAYLFSGPRGVGKTTCARIFAKTINCTHRTSDGEACNQCASCRAFNEQRSLNIYEMDAASNNSVNDIKQLIEQVQIMPSLGKYKVYIIDEVHMLSSAAFNAFLKTLEEPPAHAVFILATTEKHKLLATILSRCQIYDFNRITLQDIVAHLEYVAKSEDISYESDALQVVALKADGGMRDALSIFDQVVSYSGGALTYAKVIENLHVLDYEYYFRLVDLFLAGDVRSSMLVINEILNYGFDGRLFLSGLAGHFRNLMVAGDSKTGELLEVGATIRQRYVDQGCTTHLAFLYRALAICVQADLDYRESNNKRLLVEMVIIKLCQIMQPTMLPDPLDQTTAKIKKTFVQQTSVQGSKSSQLVTGKNRLETSPSSEQTVQKHVDEKPISMAVSNQTTPSVDVLSTVQEEQSVYTRKSNVLTKRMSLSVTNVDGYSKVKEVDSDDKSVHENVKEEIVNPNNQSISKIERVDDQRKSSGDEFVSEDRIVKVWNKLIETLPEQYKILRAVFEGRPILQRNGHEALVELLSDVDLQQANLAYQYIVNRMRSELNNSLFNIRFAIKKLKSHEQKISGVELYNHMVDKNEAVRDLRRLFDLHL